MNPGEEAPAAGARVVIAAGDISSALVNLNDASSAIAGADSLDDLLRAVTEAAQRLIGTHQAVTSRLVHGWRGATTHVSLSDKYAEYRDFDQPPQGLGVLNVVTRENRPLRLNAEDLPRHPEWRGLADAPGHPPLPDYLAAPIISRDGRNIGLIQLSDKVDGSKFTEEDEVLLVQVARMASATLEHVELLERERAIRSELEERVRESRLAAAVGIALTSARSLDDKLHCCTEAIVEHLGAAFARIWELQGDVLVLRASAGVYTHLDGPHSRVPVGAFKIGRIAAELRSHLTNDVAHDDGISDPDWARREGMVAFAGYPLVVADRCVGVLAMFSRSALPASTLTALETVADSIAVGIEESRSADSLRRRGEQLLRLSEVASAMNRATDVGAVLDLVTGAAREIVGAHQSVSSLTQGSDWSQAITAVSLSDKYAAWRDYDAPPDGSGIYARVCETGVPARMTQQELEADPGWRGFGSAAGEHPPMRGWLAVPLTAPDGSNLGVVQLSDRYDGEFTKEDQAITMQLAELASAALHKTRLYEERARVATVLQQSLLPPSLPDIPGIDLGARYAAGAEEVGGDFYDVFPLPGGAWGAVVGDVRGKGPEAASLTALARHSARTAAMLEAAPGKVLEVVNQALFDPAHLERFCSAVILRISTGAPTVLHYAAGGHPPVLRIGSGGEHEALDVTGPLLGIFADTAYRDAAVELRPGDVVVCYTDGITEARRDGEQFGLTRLAELVSRHRRLPAQAIADTIVDAVTAHRSGEDADDSAVLVLRIE